MPASPELAHYTITGAQDWPMFKEMLAGMRILFLLLWGTIGAGLGFMWRDLRNRIASQRSEDRGHCKECNGRHNTEYGYIWAAMDEVAPRSANVVAAKQRLENVKK